MQIITFLKRYLRKTSWCMQHFLTIEFYRKICNNCYWSNFYNSRHTFAKRALILFVSLISMLFLSFFYMPTDPANLNRQSFVLKLRILIMNMRTFALNISHRVSNHFIRLYSSLINTELALFSSVRPLELKASLLI